MKEFITGIGGVFYRSKNPNETRNWFETHFGLKSESWGCVFPWREFDNAELEGNTTWCPFKSETEYFGNSDQQFMINYRVRDLDLLLENLEQAGVKTVKPKEESEFGKFAWVEDIDGYRIELWEP
jgi:predicted enzyme related to lactoylglutathione lyase